MMKKNQISAVHSARQNSPPVSVLRTLYLIPILLLFGGCELIDPEPGLPPVTSTGEDTFGCMVNGELWLPYKDKKWFGTGSLIFEISSNDFGLYPVNRKEGVDITHIDLVVKLDNIVADSTYYFAPYNRENPIYASCSYTNHIDYCTYGSHAPHYGWIRFSKYDVPIRGEGNRKGVVAGEFEFTAFPDRSPDAAQCQNPPLDSIVVTQGRFDIEVP